MKSRLMALLVALLCLNAVAFAQSSAEILDKAISRLSKASSVNCSFAISGASGKFSGDFKSSGNKFTMSTPYGKTWYDGEKMWTSNPKTREITLVNPSSDEISEANPFAYLKGYKGKYKTGLSRRKDDNCFLVLINPKSGNENFKSVEIAVNKKTYLPERFIIRDNNDHITTVNVRSLSLKNKNAATEFICPVASMSDYELIDLR